MTVDGATAVTAFKTCGITHVVWIPDSTLGVWDQALSGERDLHLVRVCREGEAFAVAAGLLLGGRKPLVIIQCTGFFEAGDSLRNFVHDLNLPLFMLVGVRSYLSHKEVGSRDTCPQFTEPLVRAWQIPHLWLDPNSFAQDFISAYRAAQRESRPGCALLPE